MKLDNPVTLQRAPYTDPQTNKVVTPDPMTLEELRVTYYDQEHVKVIGAQIDGVPQQLTLFFGPDYDALGDDRSLSIFKNKMKEMMGDNPQAFLQNLFPKTLESDPQWTRQYPSRYDKCYGY